MNREDRFHAMRQQMVADQLQRRGIHDVRVLDAMRTIPREAFVPEHLAIESYADRPLPIACDQTISQPLIVAMMTQALELEGSEHVLEIGTGSGYQTAILARTAGDVVSIERHADLSTTAAEPLRRLGFTNIRCVVGDGSQGWAAEAPYDRILVTAAAAHWPEALWQQLREGGILVLPIGASDEQILQQVRKCDSKPQVTHLTACRFVPLIVPESQTE